MEHKFIIINSSGKLINTAKGVFSLRKLFHQLDDQKLRITRIFMSEQDFKDILE